MQNRETEQNVVEYIVDNLLLNRSVLFISDVFTYNSIVFELKECFEDVNLYLFSFSNFNIDTLENMDYGEFDSVVFYIKSESEKEYLNKMVDSKENILVI